MVLKSSKSQLLAIVFCFLACLGWGLNSFLLNWRVYLDANSSEKRNQPVAISIMLTAIANSLCGVVYIIIILIQRPIRPIKANSAFWAMITGIFYAIGANFYILSADAGLPTSIAAPVTGLHILLPPLYTMLRYREYISIKTTAGFLLSLSSLALFSGLVSETGNLSISPGEWITCGVTIMAWGIGLITQDRATKDISSKLFAHVNLSLIFGSIMYNVICALFVSTSDIRERSNWIPFDMSHVLMVSSSLCEGLGNGFFTICLYFAEDFNLMVALSSLNFVIPAILDIVFLNEQASWNVMLGLFFACIGFVTLSLEATKSVIKHPIKSTRTKTHIVTRSDDLVEQRIVIGENTPLLGKCAA